jgi:hypothetical protein
VSHGLSFDDAAKGTVSEAGLYNVFMDIDSVQVLLLDYFRIRSFSANDCRADLISWSALTMLQWNFGTFSGMLNEKKSSLEAIE